MKLRSTIWLLVVAACLYAFIHFYVAKKPGTREEAEQSRYVTSFDRGDVDGFTIYRGGELVVELSMRDGKWEVTRPVKDRADEALVAQVFTTLERIEKHEEIAPDPGEQPRASWSEYGLSSPKMRVDFVGKNPPASLLIGREAAVDNKIYVAVEGDDRIFVTDLAVREAINREADDFRDPQLSGIPATQVRKVVIGTGEGQLEIEKDGEYWNIVRPLRARADTERVAELVRGATTLRAEKFVAPDSDDLAEYGLDTLRGTVTLHTEDEVFAFDIGAVVKSEDEEAKPETPAGVYARHAERNTVVVLPVEVENFLRANPGDLRDKHLMRLNLDVVDRVKLELGGAPPITFVREKEDWTMVENGRKANGQKIIELLNTLRNSQAAAFISDTPADAEKYGLQDPQLRISVSSYASENVPEGGAGEHPIHRLAFGKTEGDVVYARLEEEPFIVSVNRQLVEEIALDPLKWNALPVFTFTLEELTEIRRTLGDHTVQLRRNEAGAWTLEGGEVDSAGAASLGNTLARLRAVRWLGALETAHGLENPVARIEFTAGGGTHRLLIGSELDEMRAATTGEGVFLINRPDYEALIGQVRVGAAD